MSYVGLYYKLHFMLYLVYSVCITISVYSPVCYYSSVGRLKEYYNLWLLWYSTTVRGSI